MNDLWKYLVAAVGVMLTASGMLWRSASYVGSLEERIKQLEQRAIRSEARGKYFHGDYQPPELERTR